MLVMNARCDIFKRLLILGLESKLLIIITNATNTESHYLTTMILCHCKALQGKYFFGLHRYASRSDNMKLFNMCVVEDVTLRTAQK